MGFFNSSWNDKSALPSSAVVLHFMKGQEDGGERLPIK